MSFWSVVVPQATTNLISNPSFETNTNGWNLTAGGTLTRTATTQRFGAWSASVAPSSGLFDGVYSPLTLTLGFNYTFSVYVLGSVGVPYWIAFTTTSNVPLETESFTGTGSWQRVSVTYFPDTANVRVFVGKGGSALTGGALFLIDGAQCEAQFTATTYADGDQAGCAWTGAPHASTSTRSAQTRAGGSVVDLDSYSAYLMDDPGAGMPPVQHVLTPYAAASGAGYQRTTAKPRVFTLALRVMGESYQALQQRRADLIAAVRPDRTTVAQPTQLRYRGGGARTMLIDALYDAGLEASKPSGFTELVGMRLLAPDPFFRDEFDAGVAVPTRTSITAARILQQNAGGAWSTMAGGMNNTVLALAVGPDGSLYAGGLFTTAGGVSANRVAKWNGSAWSALGGGLAFQVRALAVGPDGSVYAGGDFSASSPSYLAKWNGSTWSALGSGVDNSVYALAVGPDGSVYAAGIFTTAGGASANRIAKWNGSAWSALGSGLGGGGYTLVVGTDGSLYAGGQFTTAGGVSANRVAKWNGRTWSTLGSGLNNWVSSLAVDANGALIAGGLFTVAGQVLTTDCTARWNGSSWTPLSVDFPGAANVSAILATANGIAFGFDTTGSAGVDVPTVANNSGSANTPLQITFTGPPSGTAVQLISFMNKTTGDVLYFNNLLINIGETVLLDLTPGNLRCISSFRGNIISSILPGSNLATFRLMPGENTLTCFATSAILTCTVLWRPRYWSMDGGA